MKPQRWRERLLTSTRGQILALLRTDVRTVNDLAAALKLTDNAVRAHLVSLERDGLIQRHGSRPGIRKPHTSYALAADAEQIFPKAYGSLLNHLVASISRRLDRRELRASMREVGLSLANEHTDGLSKRSRKERLAIALDLLKKVGGEATYHADGKKFIRSQHCPIAAITANYPDACLIVETFLSKITGARVKQHCERGISPRCCFELTTKK
jgi:predicted ArsR family transcriptional regulator